ncbi:unnamed protein product [Adineta steineri]|uniref:Uncharacterized protein n=1 Tax=Adineta steineri TaxID=433720 RepID=A0A814R1U7_9BILA|nr:unnamed protein product [Adineta steineri]CAF1469050.1 unnamed protein product [Adineta steineri]CAF1469594.1 unnamed protein product [Adineta steineri]
MTVQIFLFCFIVTSVTMPPLPPPVVIHNLVEKKLPLVEHDKPKVVAHRADPKPTPSLHPEKSREINAKPCKRHRPDSCSQNICKQYSINLKMNKAYFNFRYNKCFCSQCYPITKADYFTVAGSIYTVPRHWTRFGLQIDQTFAESKQIFKQWYTTFYGTSKDKLESIINNRFVPMPGDHLLSNEIFTTHLSDKHHVYTSPSIKYACLKHVCPIDILNIHSEWYDVQIVLECKQNPEGIVKQHGYRQNVCNIIPDNEIEWKTDRRASIIPYGLLIHVQKHRCTKECINIHS